MVPDDESHSVDRGSKDSMVLARAIGEAHRRYTRMKNLSDGVRGYLFQGRFGSCVLDERHLLAAARYVELNPVTAGMVKEAVDYSWSSARELGIRKAGRPLKRHREKLVLCPRNKLPSHSKDRGLRYYSMNHRGRDAECKTRSRCQPGVHVCGCVCGRCFTRPGRSKS